MTHSIRCSEAVDNSQRIVSLTQTNWTSPSLNSTGSTRDRIRRHRVVSAMTGVPSRCSRPDLRSPRPFQPAQFGIPESSPDPRPEPGRGGSNTPRPSSTWHHDCERQCAPECAPPRWACSGRSLVPDLGRPESRRGTANTERTVWSGDGWVSSWTLEFYAPDVRPSLCSRPTLLGSEVGRPFPCESIQPGGEIIARFAHAARGPPLSPENV